MADNDINDQLRQHQHALQIRDAVKEQQRSYKEDPKHPITLQQAKRNLEDRDQVNAMDALKAAQPAHKDQYGLRGQQPENAKLQINGHGVSGDGNQWTVKPSVSGGSGASQSSPNEDDLTWKARLDTAESNISTLQGNVSTLQGDMTSAESRLDALEAWKATLSTTDIATCEDGSDVTHSFVIVTP